MEEYMQFYNQSRPQRKLNKLPPKEYQKQLIA
ncbi:IS3 family transposase [Paenibacillus polymyxa]